ncbi:MAG: 2-amino-4-hydroxy-6-hydroxymethyldihydropteridine diphosphokinase [Kiritimatiellae bacterium]|nr:2-amino-4-hydroxy-6-hydroxymethyldihydropteridine diphosphokinase [Kiritimatiellia bacterium]
MTVVALGSNLVPREQYLAAALRLLGELPQTRLVSASRVIETEGVDVPEEYRELKFLNQVAVFESSLEALEFSRRMHAIEDRLGRVRTVKNGPRTIDLDLVWHNGVILDTPELTLPHPRARERAFVMEPLEELGLAGLIKDAL